MYSQARKQNKRPKSSSNSQGPNKKVVHKKPVLFSTIDNRNTNAFMSQKFTYNDTKGVPSHLISSPSQSPNKDTTKKHIYEVVNDQSGRQKVKYTKQPISIKNKNEAAQKVFKVYPYQYNNEKNEYIVKDAKKVYPKTERYKFKLSNDKIVRKENIMQIADVNTLNSARDLQSNLTDRSNNNTLKWTLKSTKDYEKTAGSKHRIDDFERLFYQSMSNEKGKIISNKGVDFNHMKSFKVQNPSHYRSLSKHKSSKHVKNKKSLRAYESKSKKSKRNSPNGHKSKNRCTSRVNK